ncbi:12051_t:CDS:2 [Funneliformis caledonium]|uniref:12051_t:CDS:1 n=1 Tax=Funneliformis caledonium TaxID=1117310 RepID=A0A9N8WR95_9GLOM|nr:12051_t:CDS:2 [Funneliformis caledonium]
MKRNIFLIISALVFLAAVITTALPQGEPKTNETEAESGHHFTDLKNKIKGWFDPEEDDDKVDK